MGALKDLVFRSWSVSDRQNTLQAQLWNGTIGFAVFPRDRSQGGRPLLKINLDQNDVGYIGLMSIIEKLKGSPLSTKIPMSRTEFNPQTKTRSNAWVITFEKDPDMIYKITLTDCKTNTTFTFPITVSQSIVIGSDPVDKAKQSALGLAVFKNWLERAHDYAPMTAERGQFGGNRGQGGGRPGPTPAAAAVAPSVENDPEDLPF